MQASAQPRSRGAPKGHPRWGGRKKGSRNKKTRELIATAEAAGEMPHEFMLRVSRGGEVDGHPVTFQERLTAAEKAASFFAPKLAAMAHTGPNGGAIDMNITVKFIKPKKG